MLNVEADMIRLHVKDTKMDTFSKINSLVFIFFNY